MSEIFPILKMFDPETDYAIVKEWWVGHGWNAVPISVLPKLGIVANLDGGPVAAGWLYMDNSIGVSMMEWVVSNPGAKPKSVYRSIKAIVEFLKGQAKSFGYSVMLTTCKQESLARVYEKTGFQRTDTEMIHLVQTLN
jgi:hypothetical protein